MTSRYMNLRLAVAALTCAGAVGFVAVPAQAQNMYYAPSANTVYGRPVAHDRMGHFSCSMNELKTRLEGKNCGNVRTRW